MMDTLAKKIAPINTVSFIKAFERARPIRVGYYQVLALAVANMLAPAAGAAPPGLPEPAASRTATIPHEIEWRIGKDFLVLRSESRFAGAISSIRFRGVEFIDATDHGRLLSGAIQFDGWGECLNPTLPGGMTDTDDTSSILLSVRATADSYEASTRMAYWLRPGTPHHVNLTTGQSDFTSPQPCERPPADQAQTTAVNSTVVSNVVYTQNMKVSFAGVANAVLDEISFDVEDDHSKVVVEALTGYMPSNFINFYLYSQSAGTFLQDKNVAAHPGEQPAPIIAATPDGKSAIGVLSLTREPTPLYGRWVLSAVSKWNIVFRPNGVFPKGRHVYRCVWAIGSLAEVQTSLSKIMEYSANNPIP